MTLELGLEVLSTRRAWEAENCPPPQNLCKKSPKIRAGHTRQTLTKNAVEKAAIKKNADALKPKSVE